MTLRERPRSERIAVSGHTGVRCSHTSSLDCANASAAVVGMSNSPEPSRSALGRVDSGSVGEICLETREQNLLRNPRMTRMNFSMEVIHKSEFGVSEQSIFVGIILILVNGHPRGGVSAFFREISAFFLIQNFVKFHAFPTCG